MALDDLLREIPALSASCDGLLASSREVRPDMEEDIWRVYSRLERIVALMKLRLGIEEPGGIISRTGRNVSLEDALEEAAARLKEAAGLVTSNEHRATLTLVKEARDRLRVCLVVLNRRRRREQRAKRSNLSRPSSS